MAFKLLSGNSQIARTTKLIGSIRSAHVTYKESPDVAYDSINYFSNEHLYLGNIGITSRQFVEDDYIFRDGIIEDVPIGFAGYISPGYQRKHKTNRYYIGAHLAHADYYEFGFLNVSLGYGAFFHKKKTEQSTLAIELNYFSNLISLGKKWKMRQFIKPQILLGFKRLNTIADRLNLNDEFVTYGYDRNEFREGLISGITGFNSDIYGTKKGILSVQTQFYAPWNILGFRLNPYLNITSGIIGNENRSLFKNQVYNAFSAGLIIRNDYLVFSSFQLSFTYFPKIPGQGSHVFKTNAFETSDFGFRQIEIGKPSTVWYE